MTHDVNRDLAELVEALAVEADPSRRDRLLLEAAELASQAAGVCLWQATADGWHLLAGRGDLRALPTAGEVHAVTGGELGPELPPSRVVAHAGDRALALGGLPPGTEPQELLDQLDALLVTTALVAGNPAADLADLLHPVLPNEPTARRPRAADLEDLRHLPGLLPPPDPDAEA